MRKGTRRLLLGLAAGVVFGYTVWSGTRVDRGSTREAWRLSPEVVETGPEYLDAERGSYQASTPSRSTFPGGSSDGRQSDLSGWGTDVY